MADAEWRLESAYDRWFQVSQATDSDRQKTFDGVLTAFSEQLARLGRIAVPTESVALQAFGQHHGLPTRLLDWSASPFIAAYFAFRECLLGPHHAENVAVWALDTHASLWGDDRGARVVRLPASDNPRMTAQQGLFTVADFSHGCLEDYVAKFQAPTAVLTQFVLPSRLASAALAELAAMDITETRIFPDPEGCARTVILSLRVAAAGTDAVTEQPKVWEPRDIRPDDGHHIDKGQLLITGRRGSGKSVRLRQLRSIRVKSGRLCTVLERDPISSRTVNAVWAGRRREDVLDVWKQLWRCAIYRTVASHFLFDPHFPKHSALETACNIHRDLLSSHRRPLGPYSQLVEIISTTPAERLAHYTDTRASGWQQISEALTTALGDKRPVQVFVDCFEQQHQEDPLHWQMCQRALSEVAEGWRPVTQIEVVLALPDSAVQAWRTGNGLKHYSTVEHLVWDRETLTGVTTQIIAATDKLSAASSFEEWLGLRNVRNEKRGRDEPLTDYLLRHTRMLPRDLVILTDALSHIAPAPSNRQAAIRTSVALCAAQFCREQLELCAVEAIARRAAFVDPSIPYSDVFATNPSYVARVVDELGALVDGIAVDRWLATDSNVSEACGKSPLSVPGVSALDLLWRHGLVGGSSALDGEFEFNDGQGPPTIPPFSALAFHPCVNDYRHSIKALPSHGPITPNYRGHLPTNAPVTASADGPGVRGQ